MSFRHRSDFIQRLKAGPTARRPNSFVYAIGTAAYVKIGFSIDPVRRTEALQTAHPETLTLFALWPGTELDEQTIHLAWTHRRLKGEWFRPEVMDPLGLPWTKPDLDRHLETWDAGKRLTERVILAGLASQAEAGVLGETLAALKGRTTRTQYAALVAMSRLIDRAGGAKP